jgi:glycosyltransferase involved in cell wall biosynthesis
VRIAVLAPIAWRVPPRHYGPWELFTSLLTEGLVSRGHEVTLFATGDSETSARLYSVVARGWSEDPRIDPKVVECLHVSQVFERASEFDLIHNSFDFLPLTYSALVSTPVVTTIHGFSSPDIVPVFAKYNQSTFYVAISDADRHPALDYVATIHHGIETGKFNFSPKAGSYLAFFGRIHPDKGVVAAIDAAEKTGIPIRLAGIIQDDQYFKREIVPRLDGDRVRFVGPVRAEDRSSFLGGAVALLHLIDFDEPFGLSVVEAMACGTPVIAFNRGSMPELIADGTTGSLVSDVASAAAAIMRVGQLDRQTVRDVAVQRFSSDRMIDAYVGVYEHAIAAYQLRSSCGSADVATAAFGPPKATSLDQAPRNPNRQSTESDHEDRDGLTGLEQHVRAT